MNQEPVVIRAEWDPEAEVWWVSETSYPGLNAEAPTLDALVKRVREAFDSLREVNAEDAQPAALQLTIAA